MNNMCKSVSLSMTKAYTQCYVDQWWKSAARWGWTDVRFWVSVLQRAESFLDESFPLVAVEETCLDFCFHVSMRSSCAEMISCSDRIVHTRIRFGQTGRVCSIWTLLHTHFDRRKHVTCFFQHKFKERCVLYLCVRTSCGDLYTYFIASSPL